MADFIISFKQQYRLFNFQLERALLLSKGQMEARAQGELRAQASDHGIELSIQQDRVDRRLKLRDDVDATLLRIRTAQAPLTDIRFWLGEAKAAAQKGDPAAFDSALLELNYRVGSANLDPNNLIGRRQPDSVSARTTVFALGRDEVSIQTQSLGASYSLDIGGSISDVDPRDENAIINGVSYAVREFQYVSGTGDSVTFATQSGAGPTFTATVNRGGLGVANSFFYGNLPSDASPESAAFRQRAMDDLSVAQQTLNRIENNLGIGEATALAALGGANTALEEDNKIMGALVERQLSEQAALETSLQAKIDLATAGFALSSQTALVRIRSLFAPEPPLTDTILDTLGIGGRRR
jgi:hypothetical protein